MSVIQELASGLRTTSEQLPISQVITAADRLAIATELLAWVRQSSPHPIGVPHLAAATDHLETAVRALISARDRVEDYLLSLGLAGASGQRPTGELVRRPVISDESTPAETPRGAEAPLYQWWAARIDLITSDDPEATRRADATSGPTRESPGARGARGAQSDPLDLLQAVAEHVRSEDRSGLRRTLRQVDPPVGLGLAALSPTALRRTATDVLGHEPGPDDLPRLREMARSQVRQVVPGLPDGVCDTILSRTCRIPPEQRARQRKNDTPDAPEVDHPADSAVAGAVLVGVLLRRLGRTPDSLRDQPPPERPHA